MSDRKSLALKYLSLVDLTSLNDRDSEETITALCTAAMTPDLETAAVCVYPQWVPLARSLLTDSKVKIATVINFPHGQLPPTACASQIADVKNAGVDEIDFVINWRAFLADGDEEAVRRYVRSMVNLCKPCITKCILETSKLSPDQIHTLSRIAIECGVNFLKTSTGKEEGGASVEAVTIFAEEIKRANANVGIKPSGGIRSFEDCDALWTAATDVLSPNLYSDKSMFRFGASGVRACLVRIVEDKENQKCRQTIKSY